MITDIARMWLTRSARPFVFQNEYDQQLSYSDCTGLGLYVHIPFCRSICGFCPYCKVRYSLKLCDRYIDALLQEIWDTEGTFVEENTLFVTIARLRKKIEKNPSEPVYLKTVYGIGYMFEDE